MEINTKEKLTLIARHAKAEPKLKFTSLMHLLNVHYLMDCYRLLKKGKAAGIDGRTLESYTEEEMKSRLEEVVLQIKEKKILSATGETGIY